MQATPEPTPDTPAPAAGAADAEETKAGTKKRPRIDMTVEPRERKRGKTMFGLVLGTLARAKNEDKERNASDAVRLQLPQSPHPRLLTFTMSLLFVLRGFGVRLLCTVVMEWVAVAARRRRRGN